MATPGHHSLVNSFSLRRIDPFRNDCACARKWGSVAKSRLEMASNSTLEILQELLELPRIVILKLDKFR